MASRPLSDRLIVALDVAGYGEAEALIRTLSPHAGWFKVGSILFTREGERMCRLVKESGAKLFLDLKFHDIPNTVRGAVGSALAVDADMLTIHAAGGEAMLRAAVRAKDESGKKALIVGVTVLTHLSQEDFASLFVGDRSLKETVLFFAKLAERSGLDGVVASAQELPIIKRHLGPEFVVVTPGIRLPDAHAKDDQARVVTPKQAAQDGADYIVVGRPITEAPDPAAACQRFLENMGS